MILAVLTLLVAALTAEPAPKAEIDRARFQLPTFGLAKPSPTSRTVFIGGAVRTSFVGVAKPSVRCPLLRIVCLCVQNGSYVCYHGFWNELDTYTRLRSSDVNRAMKDAGLNLTGDSLKKAQSDPQQISLYLPEVTRERYGLTCTYGNPQQKGSGFFRLAEPMGNAKLLLVHLEMWQNGVKIGEYESSHSGLGKYGFPADWHVWKKYPQKFKYVDAP